MEKAPSDRRDLSPEQKEDIRVGYQVAVTAWVYMGDLVWTKYNAMLVVNGIVTAIVGVGLTSDNSSSALSVGLPIVGLILCVLWIQLVQRGRKLYEPYLAAARKLEESLDEAVQVIKLGTDFAMAPARDDGRGKSTFEFEDRNVVIKINTFAKIRLS